MTAKAPEVKALDETEERVRYRVRYETTVSSDDASALLATLDATRAQLAEEQTAHATLRALWDARCGTIASVQARLEEAEGKLQHNVRAEAEFRALTADVNADRERELFATEEKLAAAQARLTEAEGLLVSSAAYVRADQTGIAFALARRIDTFLAPRPGPAKGGGA